MKLAPGTPLVIGLWGDMREPPQPVGRIVMAGGVAQLEWSGEAINDGHAIAPLLYPLEPGLHPARSREFAGLHGFLADSLPDAWGLLLQGRRLQKLGYSIDALDPVDRLALVGRQGRGALVFEPETLAGDQAEKAIDLDAIADDARHILNGETGELEDLLVRLGGGSGGARPKIHVAVAPDGALCAENAQEADREAGYEEWIVKFPARSDPADIGPVEEAYARMAREAGIAMAATRLYPGRAGGGYFATRRFDRPLPHRRRHMVSLGGALEASPHVPSLDYDGFLKATFAITRDMRDVAQAFRRMVFNILAHNRDDHVRQHGFLMEDKGDWRLAPAFDLTFAQGPGGEHYMAVEGEGRDITRSHVDRLGARHGLDPKQIAAIIDDVEAALSHWPRHARATGVGGSLETITAALAERAGRFTV